MSTILHMIQTSLDGLEEATFVEEIDTQELELVHEISLDDIEEIDEAPPLVLALDDLVIDEEAEIDLDLNIAAA